MYLEGKGDGVNGDDSPPGIVLQCASEECLRKEEPRDPEHRGDAPVYPLSNELYSGDQVRHPCSQGFETGVGLERESQCKNGLMNTYSFIYCNIYSW